MNVILDPVRHQQSDVAHIHPVILSGGAGTRLWPLSRRDYPKQLLSLTSSRSMIQETTLRTSGVAGYGDPIIVCNTEHRYIIAEQLAEAGVTSRKIIVEPVGRNTCPAVAAVAFWLVQEDPDALMLVQPSDHVIADTTAFRAAVNAGIAAANLGKFVTFGITPTHPATGFGYIQSGAQMEGAEAVRVVDRFVEKPDSITAQGYVSSGQYLWNGGIFLLRARDFLAELERLNPAIWAACAKSVEQGHEDDHCLSLDANAFIGATPLSIDRAVMEHTRDAAVVAVDMGWHDVGSWRALRDVNPTDTDGNVLQGDVILDSVRNSYIRTDRQLVAAIGLENIVVVSTEDAVLVSSVDRAADVSAMVERLRHAKRSEPLHHTTVHRPWGYYRVTDSGDRFQVKRIMVKQGASISLQKHYHRGEHWVIVQGTATVRCGADTRLLSENDSIYIPVGTEHRLENNGRVPVHLIEVQYGAYLGEDDIVRLADNYGRV
ncbi:MAG TPA: mannose-1-phosphate guanylyltransferase/mannose-6-phosphate isomerase [Magnetospirillaceae bacterium]|jgi:mannose-1-phosphate guanylyltransferase/mannose-6-phosphate isomerase